MPIIEMQVPAGRVTAEQKRALHKSVGSQINQAEGGTGEGPLEGAITWMFITEHSDEDWSVGGEPMSADGPMRVFTRVFVLDGLLNDAKRKDLAERVSNEINKALGEVGILNNYCLVQEIPSGNWSAGGMIVTGADVLRFETNEENAFNYSEEATEQLRATVRPKPQ
jgi:phenylpyruvate tautomerase PptA (4-oxalocrotonate tautomerase family)